MGTVVLLTTAQIERVGQKIRNILKTLRHRKHLFESASARPPRDAALDPLLVQLQRMRLRLEFQLRKLAMEPPLGPAGDQALSAAHAVLTDAAELVDLLIWFGAEMPGNDTADDPVTLDATA